MATEHTVGFEPADRLAKDREGVRRRFWIKLKRVVSQLPFAEDLLAAYYCAFDKQTPRHVQGALLGAIAYFILARALLSIHAPDSVLATALGEDFKGKISVVIYLIAIPLALVRSWLACALYVLVAVMWLVPDRRIERTIGE